MPAGPNASAFSLDAPPVFDGHNDSLVDLYRSGNGDGRCFLEGGCRGQVDLPRARAGGFGGGLFAVYVRPEWLGQPGFIEGDRPGAVPPEARHARARDLSEAIAAVLLRIADRSRGRVEVVRTAREIESCLREGVLCAALHFEGTDAIGEAPDSLAAFYRAGLRSLGLAFKQENAFARPVPAGFPGTPDVGPGLTEAGKALVRECNRLGVLVDVSHLNERGFWDVAETSEAPLVATHSNAHALCPSPRNLTDRQLDAIRDSGGVVGVNLAVQLLRPDGRADVDTPVSDVVRHIDYLVSRLGPEHVALGSDFDGAVVPREIADVAGLSRLLSALLERGYGAEALRNLAHANWLRVLRRTWHG